MVSLQPDPITAITEPNPEAPLSEAEREILTEAEGQILLFHPGGPMGVGAAKGSAHDRPCVACFSSRMPGLRAARPSLATP